MRGCFSGVVWSPHLLGSAEGPVLGCTAHVGFKLLFASGRSVTSVCWLWSLHQKKSSPFLMPCKLSWGRSLKPSLGPWLLSSVPGDLCPSSVPLASGKENEKLLSGPQGPHHALHPKTVQELYTGHYEFQQQLGFSNSKPALNSVTEDGLDLFLLLPHSQVLRLQTWAALLDSFWLLFLRQILLCM